jgi:DNA-binding transcriptional regulator YiaG
MRCPNCKKTDTLKPWTGKTTRLGIEIDTRGERCTACGDTIVDYDEAGRQEQALAAGIIARGIRKGNEFALVRKAVGIKAIALAEMLDVRPETVSRWERGEVEIPRAVAFALGELYERPRVVRQKLEAFARACPT